VNVLAAILILAAELGSVAFPTSTTNPRAQAEFERGVAALHSFWYEEAAASFRHAEQLDPKFVMAYWGEAMTYNHPIWLEQDRDAALKVLAKAPAPTTAREAAWLATLRVLYGDGPKRARDDAYEEAIGALAAKYPADPEAQAFHALAILGTLDHGPSDERKQIRAAAILESLLPAHPSHPGVLHYMIHAYDDPLHAPLGLRAATTYARVAPAAHHALHMPSHIFLQLGMWAEAAKSNEQSYAASVAWVEREKLEASKRDLHSLTWLQYIYLQQGRVDEAKALFAKASGDSDRERSARTRMLANWAVETGEVVDAADTGSGDMAHCGMSYGSAGDAGWFARGLAAIKRGESIDAAIAGLTKEREAKKLENSKRVNEVMELSLRALDAQRHGKFHDALDFAKRGVEVEETLGAPSGPPDDIKPAHELYGELLLAANRPAEAVVQFRMALLRTPNRALSVKGLAAANVAAAASAAGK
jgi:tetratricopeptide (TPR) repeat protein